MATSAATTVLCGTTSDSDDDDLEFFCRLQEQFSIFMDGIDNDGQYDTDGQKHMSTEESFLHKPEQVHVTNIASEIDSTDNLSVHTTDLNVFEGFLDCMDPNCNNTTTHNLESLSETQIDSELHQEQSGGSGFPKSAQLLIDAIKKNRSCQKFLRNNLIQIKAKIEDNKKLKSNVKILKDFQFTCRRRTGRALSQKKDPRVQLISVAKQKREINPKVNVKKFSPILGYSPVENSRVFGCRMALTKFPLSFNRKKWSKKEKENLAKGLKQQYQDLWLQKSIDQWGVSSDFEFDNITPENIRLYLPNVNWNQLASMHVPSRSGVECQARWLNCEDPLINHHKWTNMEDKNLLHIVQHKGVENWIDIAVSLGTNRTPFQCLARYQRSLNSMILKREWSEAEDDKLRAAVEAFGESNWQPVAASLKGRTGTQCSNRWNKCLHPARQRVGKWSPEEDKRLKVVVMLFGPQNWNKIAQYMGGRTQVQCRERWVNTLDPCLNLSEWTKEEDSRLEAAIAKHGYCWSKVAACVAPRTDSQCWRRWKVLFPHQVPLFQAAKNIQKAALISNFVDRESERPTLGPNDFIRVATMNFIPESENVNPSGKWKRKSRRLMNSNGVEKSGEDDAISKKKRMRRSSSSSFPEPTLSTTSKRDRATKKKIAPSGIGRQNRKSRLRPEPKEFDAYWNTVMITKWEEACVSSWADATENKKASKLLPRRNKCTELPKEVPDSTVLIIGNSEEVLQSVGTEATKNEKASKLRPRNRKCIDIKVEAFCGNGTISKKKRRVTRPHSMKNNGTDPTEYVH